jgi:uncharacterized protein (DUF58 family)
MLTARGWWFLVLAAALLLLGVLRDLTPFALLGLTLFLWFLLEWLMFAARGHSARQHLRVVRLVVDERGPVDNLWAGRSFEVQIELWRDARPGLPYVKVTDLTPFGVEDVRGTTAADGRLDINRPLSVAYRFRCKAAGEVRFEGVRLDLADFQGFFYWRTFVTAPVVYRVLPVMLETGTPGARAKRHNVLPPPGVHRLRRPGSGSELLDLRDYMPGDPPKTIAWKVSARRDKLITKEFESEVPVRCTLFVDASNSVRLGPIGKNALSRIVEIAAVIAQTNSSNRDLTGLCLFDEAGSRIIKAGRGPRHRGEIMNRLAETATLTPATGSASADRLTPVAYAFAEEAYPQLLRSEINHVPWWMPFWWKVPTYPKRPFSILSYLVRFFLLVIALVPFTVFTFFLILGVEKLHHVFPKFIARPPSLLFTTVLTAAAIVYFLFVFVFMRVLPAVFAPRRRRLLKWRKSLSALLSVRYGLAPGGLALLLEDDEQYTLHVQRFLAEHQIPFPVPLYDSQGRYLFAAPGKIDVLTKALLQAVARGHDNELYVVLADLLELPDRLDPLVRAVRVALGRHHQVVFICPWPPDLPPPRTHERYLVAPWFHGRSQETTSKHVKKKRKPRKMERPQTDEDVYDMLEEMLEDRLHTAYERVQQALTRLGVTVICAASDRSVQVILDRMDRLRVAGIKR